MKISSGEIHNGNAHVDILQMLISGYACLQFTSLGLGIINSVPKTALTTTFINSLSIASYLFCFNINYLFKKKKAFSKLAVLLPCMAEHWLILF